MRNLNSVYSIKRNPSIKAYHIVHLSFLPAILNTTPLTFFGNFLFFFCLGGKRKKAMEAKKYINHILPKKKFTTTTSLEIKDSKI